MMHGQANIKFAKICYVDGFLKPLYTALQFLRFQATGRQHRGCIKPQAVTHSLVLLKMGEIIARNMLS